MVVFFFSSELLLIVNCHSVGCWLSAVELQRLIWLDGYVLLRAVKRLIFFAIMFYGRFVCSEVDWLAGQLAYSLVKVMYLDYKFICDMQRLSKRTHQELHRARSAMSISGQRLCVSFRHHSSRNQSSKCLVMDDLKPSQHLCFPFSCIDELLEFQFCFPFSASFWRRLQ